MPKLCDCVGKSVPAALTAATYFVVLVGMCLAAASWQSKNGLLLTLPPSRCPLWHRLCCLMVEMRLRAASWQSKNCLLRYSRSKLPILIKICCGGSECCAGAGRFVPDPVHRVPYPFQARTTHVPPPDPFPGHMAGSHIDCSCVWVMEA